MEENNEIFRPTPSLKVYTDVGKFILQYDNSMLFSYSDCPSADHVWHNPPDKDFTIRIILKSKLFDKLIKADYPHCHFPYLINDSQAYEWFIGSEVEEINLTLDEIAKHTPDS